MSYIRAGGDGGSKGFGGFRMTQNERSGFELKHPGSHRLFEYWTSLRAGRVAPYKSEVTAAGVGRRLAGNTFVIERMSDGAQRFRLAGSKIYDIFGLELRGMSAAAIMDRASRAKFRELIDEVLAAPCLGAATAEAMTTDGAATPVELLLAPLRSDFDQMNRIIGVVHVYGDDLADVDCAPRRCLLTKAATLSFDAEKRSDLRAPLPGFAEQATALEHDAPGLRAIDGGAAKGPATKGGAPRRGHLKLVKD